MIDAKTEDHATENHAEVPEERVADEHAPILEGKRCTRCDVGTFEHGTFSITSERGGATITVKDVPGYVCDTCGEKTMSGDTMDQLDRIEGQAIESSTEVLICVF